MAARFKPTKKMLRESRPGTHMEMDQAEKMRCPYCFAYGETGGPRKQVSHLVRVFDDGHRGELEVIGGGSYGSVYPGRNRHRGGYVSTPAVYAEGRGPDDCKDEYGCTRYETVIDKPGCDYCKGAGFVTVGVVFSIAKPDVITVVDVVEDDKESIVRRALEKRYGDLLTDEIVELVLRELVTA